HVGCEKRGGSVGEGFAAGKRSGTAAEKRSRKGFSPRKTCAGGRAHERERPVAVCQQSYRTFFEGTGAESNRGRSLEPGSIAGDYLPARYQQGVTAFEGRDGKSDGTRPRQCERIAENCVAARYQQGVIAKAWEERRGLIGVGSGRSRYPGENYRRRTKKYSSAAITANSSK